MRHDDHNNKRFFRSPERVFHMNGAWFFAAREGDQGPYPSHNEAEREVARYILEKTELDSFQRQRERAPARPVRVELELELEPMEHPGDADVAVLPRRAFL